MREGVRGEGGHRVCVRVSEANVLRARARRHDLGCVGGACGGAASNPAGSSEPSPPLNHLPAAVLAGHVACEPGVPATSRLACTRGRSQARRREGVRATPPPPHRSPSPILRCG